MCCSCLSRCAERLWSEEDLSPCHCATDEREPPGYQPIPEDVLDREEYAPLSDQITTREVELMTLGVGEFIVKRHRKVFRMPLAADRGDPRTRRGRAGVAHPPADQEGHPEAVSGRLSAIETADHERADCSGAGKEETKVSDILDTLGQHACLADDLAGFFRDIPKQTAFEAATTHLLLETGIISDGEEEE